MNIVIPLLSLLVLSLEAMTYSGCATTKKEALYTLSGNIKSDITTYIEERVVQSNETSIESKISSYTKASTNLSLVNIKYKKKDKEICASVKKEDQVKNTKRILNQVLLYKQENLPKDIDAKIKQLTLWIKTIQQLSFLLPLFLENIDKEQENLNLKEKLFKDLYTANIAASNALFFKTCKDDLQSAKEALNKKLFTKYEEKKERSFMDTISSLFESKNSTSMLDIFSEQLLEVKDKDLLCVMLNKEEMLKISQKMYASISRVSENTLPKDTKKRYKEIESYKEQISIAQMLFKIFPQEYKVRDFNRLNQVSHLLEKLQKKTYPQTVLFQVKGAQNIYIRLDDKKVKNNEKIVVKSAEHTYKIQADDRCPLVGTFENDLFEDVSISQDLQERKYPSVLFVSEVEMSVAVNSHPIKVNVTTSIKKCEGSVRYIAKYAQQTQQGEIQTKPGMSSTIELNFLTPQELQVFNDAKTKQFIVTSGSKFSESLTPLFSESLTFILIDSPKYGKIELHERGSFKYISDETFEGIDSFEYKIETKNKSSAPKIVNIKVKKSLKQKIVTQAKEAQEKITDIKDNVFEKKYKIFKQWVNSQSLNKETLQQIQKKYPKMFQRLVGEKLTN